MNACDCHTCLAVRYIRAWAQNFRDALARAPRDDNGKASLFSDVGQAEAAGLDLEDSATLLEEVATSLEQDRHLTPAQAEVKHAAKPTLEPDPELPEIVASVHAKLFNPSGTRAPDVGQAPVVGPKVCPECGGPTTQIGGRVVCLACV